MKTLKKSLHHKELEYLFGVRFDPDKEIFASILTLPKNTLVKDFETIIQYFIDNHPIIYDDYEETEDESFILIHALFFLNELKSESSFALIIKLLQLEDQYLDVFLGDILNEELWLVLYNLGQAQLDLLPPFISDINSCTFSKGAATSALSILVKNKIDLKETLIKILRQTLEIIETQDESETDYTLNALLVSDIVDAGLYDEFKSYISSLYENDKMDISINGTHAELLYDFEKYGSENRRDPTRGIIEIYQDLKKLFSNTEFENADDYFDYEKFSDSNKIQEPIINIETLGRNDPCRCGSGKKYKKCCME